MEFQRTYTLVEIAKNLNRPRSTVKSWAELFHEYLPTIGTGRTMRYKEEAFELFVLIAKMKDANEPNELIRQQLQETAKELTVMVTNNDEPKSLIMGILESYGEVMTELKQQRDMIQALSERVESIVQQEVKQEIEQAKKEIASTNETLSNKVESLTKQIETQQQTIAEQMQAHKQISSTLETFITETRAEKHKKKSLWDRIWGK